MNFPIQAGQEFFLDLPPFVYEKIYHRETAYDDTYLALFTDYLAAGRIAIGVNGLDVPTVQGWVNVNCPIIGQIRDPYPGPYTSEGWEITPRYWEAGAIPGSEADWVQYCLSAAGALQSGYMYGMMLAMTAIRVSEKGYFGRPPKE